MGSPGAVGPFEGIVFMALPTVPVADLAAAVLVYRVVYYVPSFLLALGFIVFGGWYVGYPLGGAQFAALALGGMRSTRQPEGEMRRVSRMRVWLGGTRWASTSGSSAS